jgi:hypothetical protein
LKREKLLAGSSSRQADGGWKEGEVCGEIEGELGGEVRLRSKSHALVIDVVLRRQIGKAGREESWKLVEGEERSAD